MLKSITGKLKVGIMIRLSRRVTKEKPSGKLACESKLQMKKERQIIIGIWSLRVIFHCLLHLVLPVLRKKKIHQPPTSSKTTPEMPQVSCFGPDRPWGWRVSCSKWLYHSSLYVLHSFWSTACWHTEKTPMLLKSTKNTLKPLL